MSYEPIKELHIENYGCIKKASFALSPLHALIGPNDSGKSTTLRALRTVAQCAVDDWTTRTNTQPFEPMLGDRSSIGIDYSDGLAYGIQTGPTSGDLRVFYTKANLFRWEVERAWMITGTLQREGTIPVEVARIVNSSKGRFTTATMVRFDPNALRQASNQLLAREPIRFAHETGEGLASVYQAINSRDVDAFVAIRDRARTFFPTIQTILVPTVSGNSVVLQARLTDNTLVPAEALSEGLLYFLGFMALQHLAESRLFLVEEPENGLHPARVSEVMAILREISKTSQVIVATHSPLVVNELQGHEVSVVTRDPDKGTQVKLLKDVPGFEEASKVYQPGEFWVSYCDGNQEEPLLTGRPRT
jgi:ABC-type uncharacterized transport system ATPase subunit